MRRREANPDFRTDPADFIQQIRKSPATYFSLVNSAESGGGRSRTRFRSSAPKVDGFRSVTVAIHILACIT